MSGPDERSGDAEATPDDAEATPDDAEATPGDAEATPGGRYEAALPDEERRADGQFYTPPPIARALVEWALPAPSNDETGPTRSGGDGLPRVLDPAAGAGAFALAAYDRLVGTFDAAAPTAVDRIALVDVNGTPLSLAAEALADRAGVAPEAVRTRATSFFDCEPGDLGGPEVGRPEDDARPGFDAVVGNPPFVRHEDVADKEHYRDHLAALGPEGATPYRDGDRALSGRSDASVYFLTHATRFLRPGGRLAFVAPRKWLTARYGESLRAFVADHYRVAAVASFPDRAFDGALVDTLLVLLERRADPAGPARLARLARLAGPPDGGTLREVTAGDAHVAATRSGSAADGGVTAGAEDPAGRPDRATPAAPSGPTVVEGPADEAGSGGRRVVDLPRRRFRRAAKLAQHLDAPAPVLDLLGADRLTPLGSLADVTYGYKTGANDFFFLAPADRERWPVADRFLAPAVTGLRQVAGRDLRAADVETSVLDVHGYVASVLDGGGAGDPTATVKDALARDGHDALREYVERGERRGYHERSTCAARRVWFDLGPLEPPAVLHPKFFDERVVVARNRDGLVPSNAIDCLRLHDDVPPAALLGALNATLHRTLLECFGRAEGGGALQLMTYELSAVPVLDVRALSAAECDRVGRAFESLVAAEGATTDGVAAGRTTDGSATEEATDGVAAGRTTDGAATEGAADGAAAGGATDASAAGPGATDESTAAPALDRLDRAVLDALGAAVNVERLRECRRAMVERRVDGATGDSSSR